MIIRKPQNTQLLIDMIENSASPVYVILDDKKIELTGRPNLLKLFKKYWSLEDVTEVILEVASAYGEKYIK